MPLMQSTRSYGDTFPPVIAKVEVGMKSPMAVDLDFNGYTQKIFPPGFFAGTDGAGYRLLPRTRFKSGTTAVITVSNFTAGAFRAGDVITQINLADGTAGTAVGTVQSVQHSANTITLTAVPGAFPAVDAVIGVATSRPVMSNGNRLGIMSPNTVIDLQNDGIAPTAENSHFACFVNGTYWRALMPHLDSELERLFPETNFI